MATIGQVIAETFIGALQGQKYQDDTNALISTRTAIVRAMRPDVVASIIMPGGVPVEGILSLAADFSQNRDQAATNTTEALDSLLSMARGEVAKLQLQAVLGARLGPDTPLANRLFEQMGLMSNLSLVLSSVGISAEVASLGQIDRATDEVRKYLDYSGATQLVNFGYGQILGEVLGEPLGQELRSVTGHTLLGLNDLVTLQYRRPSFNPDKPAWDADLYSQVVKYGLDNDKSLQLLQAYLYYPQVQDWIRFAVRDVFNPAAVEAGKYDDGFPESILVNSRKAGVSDQALRWYWRAHWELPSPTMAYEMLHRGQITESELDGLLRLADYAPGWVPKMIAISYNPLTRIDARRMYADGIIDRDRYLRAMMDLGYNQESAELFVKWTDAETVSKDKDLTAAQMKKAFTLGLIMESDYSEYLKGEGYDEEEVKTLLALDAAETANKSREQAIKLAQKRYKYKITSEDGLKAELQKAGVKPERLQMIVDDTITERKLGRKLPSKADLIDWLKKGLISGAECSGRLEQLGFSQVDAEMFVMAAGLSKSQSGPE